MPIGATCVDSGKVRVAFGFCAKGDTALTSLSRLLKADEATNLALSTRPVFGWLRLRHGAVRGTTNLAPLELVGVLVYKHYFGTSNTPVGLRSPKNRAFKVSAGEGADLSR